MKPFFLTVPMVSMMLLAPPMRAQSTPQAAPAKPAATQPAAAKPAAPAVTALTDTGWPRTIASGTTKIVIYQPQIDVWDGYHVDARAAVSITEGSGSDAAPVFGIIEMSATTRIDKDAGLVTFENPRMKKATFPGNDAKADGWSKVIQSHAARLKPITLERFQAAVAVNQAQRKGETLAVKNDPPIILTSNTPAMLILVDGDPVYREVKGTSLTRVLNSRPLLLKDGSGKHYLKIFDGWMQAPALSGPWTVIASVPGDVDKALKEVINEKAADLLIGGDPSDPKTAPSLKTQTPKIFVETRPAELLVFEGAPKFVPLEGTQLMYAENTTGHLFVDAGTQKAFVLVTGRWFNGPTNLQGPWAFVPGDQLPRDFPLIPDDSKVENVKASIPGTEQAEEAVVANSIPQTAQVKKSEAKFAPQYDGAPSMKQIEGTQLQYVANSSQPVILVGQEYFGVQNAVWFVANNPNGPWLVASTVPPAIYSIPASSPLHYVTYVKVYDSTPEYVIVGYTPGYTGVYVSNGCVVYGTGYVYQPWIGTVWYGPPVTYGFGVSIAYTPWAGWHVGFGFGWTWGAATVAVGWGWGAYPWWGGYGWGPYYPYVYRPGGVAWGPRGGAVAWGPGYWGGATGNVYHRWGSTTAVTRAAGGYNAWTGNAWASRAGRSYNSRTGVAAAGQRGVTGNVYTGNYAAGSRGAAVNTRTGTAAAGRTATAGNAYTGREVQAGQGVVRGPGGNVTTGGYIRGDEGGVARVGNNVYAGHDGNVYRNNGDGWQQYTRGGGWQNSVGDSGGLDRERAGRINGNWQSGAARSGGYHGGTRSYGGGARRGGGGRRR